MGGGRKLLNRDAGRQHACKVEFAAWRFALVRIRSLDEFVFRRSLAFALFGIPRSDHRRIDEFVHAVRGNEQLGVLELDDDGVARQDVGQLHREHVGPALFQQRRVLALALGRFECTRRLLAFLDPGDRAYIADGHRHAVDGRARGRREDVAGVNRPRAAVLVHLPDRHVRDHPGDGDVDSRVLQRQAVDGRVAAFDEKVRRQRLVSALRVALCRRIARRHKDNDDDSDHQMANHTEHVSRSYLIASATLISAAASWAAPSSVNGSSGPLSTRSTRARFCFAFSYPASAVSASPYAVAAAR